MRLALLALALALALPRAASADNRHLALHREALVHEIRQGTRPLIAHDQKAPGFDHPASRFLIVRDMMAYRGPHEHLLGILTPAQGQPDHISRVSRDDVAHLGRMVWTLMFADRLPGAKGVSPQWRTYVNLFPAVPRLHVHGEPAMNAQAPFPRRGRPLAKRMGYSLYRLQRGVIAVADKELGELRPRSETDPVKHDTLERLLGEMWLDVAAASGSDAFSIGSQRGAQIQVRTNP